jgi:hypothetical protein
VLPRSGFGDNPPLSHPPSQQSLPHRVVDLVGAGVIQVLPLEQHTSADQLAEPRGF